VVLSGAPIERLHPFGRGAEPNCRGDRRRPGFEPSRRRPEGGVERRDLQDHLSAGHERRHRVKQLASAPEHAGAIKYGRIAAALGDQLRTQRR
jgi:hypothetical protein